MFDALEETTREGREVSDAQTRQQLEAAIRGMATAGKTLKLYPPTSPIPRQAIETASAAIEAYLEFSPVLSLSIARDGFSWLGEPLGIGVPGVSDLADSLREHGVAELDVLPGCTSDELMSFLDVVMRSAEEIRAEGGVGSALASANVESIRTTDVKLTVVENAAPAEDEDIDEFLRQLASDPDRLAAWMAAASAGDPSVFAEGLEGLATAAGDSGLSRLAETMAHAFMLQEHDGQDAVLGLALEPGTVQQLAREMFGHLGTGDIASSLTGGLFGENMLSLSNALTQLPLEQRMHQVYEDVQRMLANGGRGMKETSFLEHMLEVRQLREPETPLVEADPTYLRVAEVATLGADEVDDIRRETEHSRESVHVAGVQTMLTLLDQQEDFEMYCRSVDSLASTVPRLIETGELEVSSRVLQELSAREARAVQPWPELTARLREAITKAVGQRSMTALLRAVIADPQKLPLARDIMHIAGEAAGPSLIAEAIASKDEGVQAAEELLGRRVLDLLVSGLPQAQWFQLGPAVTRLAREGDPRSMSALETVVHRPDEQSRREAGQALASVGGPGPLRLLGVLLEDPSMEVAVTTVRALAKHDTPNSAAMLAHRLDALDVDGKDYPLAREIIGALARLSDSGADEPLHRLATRKALIKRGHHAEVQDLVKQAIAVRHKRGDER